MPTSGYHGDVAHLVPVISIECSEHTQVASHRRSRPSPGDAGRYGRGRTAAIAFSITSPNADDLVQKWGAGDNRYYSKFARNLVYWVTESSAIGRRRLVRRSSLEQWMAENERAAAGAMIDPSLKNHAVGA